MLQPRLGIPLGQFRIVLMFAIGLISACNSAVEDARVTAAPSQKVGGNVTGLTGSELVIQNNGGDDVTINEDGAFSFPTTLSKGADYNITVLNQPSKPNQVCSVVNGNSRVANTSITNVIIICSTNSYSVGGTVFSLLGKGLVLQNNGVNDLTIDVDGSFTFSDPLADTSPYTVSIATQPSNPSQTCELKNASETLSGANITNVNITCSTNSYTIGGEVIGLLGSGLKLQNNNDDDLNIDVNGNFVFATAVSDGNTYDISILNQPTNPSQSCTVSSGGGSLMGNNFSGVLINCKSNSYTIG